MSYEFADRYLSLAVEWVSEDPMYRH